MGLIKLMFALSTELLGSAIGRAGVNSNSPARPVGVITSQLTHFQARCLLAALAFWAVVSVITLPSLLIFGLILLPIWATAEIAFLIWWYLTYSRLNLQPVPHRPPPHINPRDVFDRFIHGQAAMSKYLDINQMISKWHWDMPISQLTRDNVANLLCYGFYYRTRQQMIEEGMAHVPDQLVEELEAAWGVKFPGGPYVPRPIMEHLLEPVRCFYRPLAFYAGVEILIALKHVMLLVAGFQAHMFEGMRYYTYGLPAATAAITTAPLSMSRCIPAKTSGGDGSSATDTSGRVADTPILFLHGVGLGVLPYLNFLLRLSSLGRPAVAVEVRHLSMRFCTEVPDEDEIVERITGALQRHGVRQVHTVAHSYGTFMASRLVQVHRSMVASLTLMDPVCFIMFSGKLIYNFVYRNPLQGASSLTWFIARDLAHAVSVSRRFYWSLLNLWPDQLPEHTLVALSAQDELVPVPEVLTMLRERPSVRVRVHDGHRHAEFIKDLPEQAKMVQMVAELVEQATLAQAATEVTDLDSAANLSVITAAAAADRHDHSHADSHPKNLCKGDTASRLHPYQLHHQQQQHPLPSHARSDSASSYEAAVMGSAVPKGEYGDRKKSAA